MSGDLGSDQPKRFTAGVVAFVAFLATLAIERHLLPPVHSPLTTKLEHFEKSRDQYTTLFLGASVIYRQVDPRLFDAELERAGFRSRSFNLGAPAMSLGEVVYLARQILDARPAGLRHLVVDSNLIELEHSENRLSTRFIAWHDVSTTALSISSALASAHDRSVRGGVILGDARAFLYRTSRVGAITSGWWDERDDYPLGDEGFLPLRVDDPNLTERRQRFLGRLGEYREHVEALRDGGETQPASETARRVFTRIADDCRKNGVTLVVISGPVSWRDAPIGVVLPFVDFRDPARYPELYDTNVRFDREHLTAEGARIFTRLLAQRFIELGHAVH